MSSGVPFLDETMWRAKRTREPVGASEFGGAPGPDPHAHADPPPSHRGYLAGPLGGGRYMPIMPPASVSDIEIDECWPESSSGLLYVSAA